MLKIEGIDNLQRRLRQMESNAREVHGTNNVPLPDLLNDSFVSRYTSFDTLDAMLGEYGGIDSGDDLQTEEWSAFVSTHSQFDSWKEMVKAAGVEWVKSKVGV